MEVRMKVAILGAKSYKKKDNTQGYQATFSGSGLTFDMGTGGNDLTSMVSDLEKGDVTLGDLVCEVKVFEGKPYLAYKGFEKDE